ncbi:MAG: hypothetical protein KDD40_00110, partial [Bdellovibrionales bacterium]|nr:hypothetical protein [Bdellovibrionales bacterium]
MLASKFSPVYILWPLLFATACWSPKQSVVDEGGKGNATFYISKVHGISTSHNIMSKDWNIPKEKNYRYEVCLKDKVTRKELVHQKFVVESLDPIRPFTAPVKTTDNGCLSWREDGLAFDYYAPSKYLLFMRSLRPADDSVHTGSVNLRLVVNPWAPYRMAKGQKLEEVYWWENESQAPVDESKIILDPVQVKAVMRGMNIPGEQRGKLFIDHVSVLTSKLADVFYTTNDSQLNIDDPNALILEQPASERECTSKNITPEVAEKCAHQADAVSGFDIEMHLELKPTVQVENINGDIVYLDIPKGKFQVFAELVATELGEGADKNLMITGDKSKYRHILTSKTAALEVETETSHMGLIRPKIQATITRRVTQGRLKLALRVRPVDIESLINPYEGLYVIGDHKKLVSGATPKLDMDSYFGHSETFDFITYMQNSSGFKELQNTYAFHMKPFDFSVAKGNYVMVLPGETATQRTVAFRVETCIFDNATQMGRQLFKQFRIKRDGVEIPIEDSRTNEEGCLILLGKVSHAFYKIEELKPTIFEIEYDAPNLVAKKQGIKAKNSGTYTLVVYTNPWDDKFTFFRDERQMSKELKQLIDEQKKIESRFFISSFSYQTLRFGYEIDEFLNLTVEKSVLLRMEPYVLRYSGNVPGRNNIQRLRDGIYLMKVAYQKDYLDPAAKGVLIERKTTYREYDNAPLNLYGAQIYDPYINNYRDLTN